MEDLRPSAIWRSCGTRPRGTAPSALTRTVGALGGGGGMDEDVDDGALMALALEAAAAVTAAEKACPKTCGLSGRGSGASIAPGFSRGQFSPCLFTALTNAVSSAGVRDAAKHSALASCIGLSLARRVVFER
eukprot:scaffold36827_cov33-Tisochrysis_lutea.AAC.3